MTLGCGAVAGNSTSDNLSPLHLINIKRLAHARPYDRGMVSRAEGGEMDRATIVAAVERYLARRGVAVAPAPVASEPPPRPAAPAITIVDFVCEDDVRRAIRDGRKIYTGPKTIVTPAAHDLAASNDILVVAKR